MNEYWLMLLVVGLAAALAWAFFLHLARLVIWGSRPTLDAWRYGLITVCLVIEIGNAFEAWEAALLCAISVLAYCVIRRERNRFESAMQELKARAHRFPGESSAHRYQAQELKARRLNADAHYLKMLLDDAALFANSNLRKAVLWRGGTPEFGLWKESTFHKPESVS